MPSKSKPASKKARETLLRKANEKMANDPLTKKSKDAKVPPGALVDMAPDFGALASQLPDEPQPPTELRDAADALAVTPPAQLTLPLLTDSGTLFIQGVQHLTAQLLGQPECAPLLVRINEWSAKLEEAKKLIVGDEGKIEGVKKLVIEQGQPWGEKGSKQMVLAGAIVKVKAVNHRDPSAPLTIADLDPAKVESYLRNNAAEADIEKVLRSYMKATTKWSLTDLTPTQQTNLAKMLADPGEWGQGLRECLKETKWQMMAPEMENQS